MGTNTYSIFISILFVETYGRNYPVQLIDPKRSLQEDRIELLNQKLPSTHAVRGGGPGGVRPSRYYADFLGLHWLYSSPPACTPFLHASFIVSTSNQLHRVVSYLFFSIEATPTTKTPCVPIEIKLQPSPISSSSKP